jgi:hypothetical protein
MRWKVAVMAVLVVLLVLLCPLTSWALERWPYERIAFIRDGQIWSASSKLYDQGKPLISMQNCNRLFGSPQRGILVFQETNGQIWAWEKEQYWQLFPAPLPGQLILNFLLGISPTGKGVYLWQCGNGSHHLAHGYSLPTYLAQAEWRGVLFTYPGEIRDYIELLETVSVNSDQNYGALLWCMYEGPGVCSIFNTSTKLPISEIRANPEGDIGGAGYHPTKLNLLAYTRNFGFGVVPLEIPYGQVVVKDCSTGQETTYYTNYGTQLTNIVWTPDGQNIIFQKGYFSDDPHSPSPISLFLLTLNPISTYEILRNASWPAFY